MNAINVVKPLQDPVISKDIKEHILDRSLIKAINVVKSIHKGDISKVYLMARNLINIIMN